MKRRLTALCIMLLLAAHAGAQGVILGDVAFAGSVGTTNLYGQPAAVWAAPRQGGAWTNDGAYVWYRLAATNRHGRSGWVYSTNEATINVATGRQSATVSWTNALGGVSGYILQRRETTNAVANPAAATTNAMWTQWQALSVRIGTVLDLSWTNWSTNAWSDPPGWDHARTYPWTTPADVGTSVVARALQADTVTGVQSGQVVTAAAHAATAHAVTAQDGFRGGTGASATTGAALGRTSVSGSGGAIGDFSIAGSGGAVGELTVASDGFAGGKQAWTTDDGMITGNPIDAVQLGTGGNSEPLSLQIYDKKLMDAAGNIPADRMTNGLSATIGSGSLPVQRIQMYDWGWGSNRWLVLTNDYIEIWEVN